MLPKIISKSLTAGSANCIALSQSVAAGGNAIINGGSAADGVFTLDTQRRIAIVSAGNDSANTALIYANRQSGQPITEVLDLTNVGTAVSKLDYFSGGTVTFPQGTAGAITIGTDAQGSTDWAVPNYNITPFELNVAHQISGSVTVNFETTNDPNFWATPLGRNAPTPQPNVTEIVQGVTAGQVVSLTQPVTGWRETITAGQGTITAQAVQAGIIN
jgi:hypothetical protein